MAENPFSDDRIPLYSICKGKWYSLHGCPKTNAGAHCICARTKQHSAKNWQELQLHDGRIFNPPLRLRVWGAVPYRWPDGRAWSSCGFGSACPGAVHPTLARHGAMWASTPTNNRLLRLNLHRDAVDLHALLGADEDVLGAAQDAGLHQIPLVRRHLDLHVRREQLEALGIHEVAGV